MQNISVILTNAEGAVYLTRTFNPNIPLRSAIKNISHGRQHKWGPPRQGDVGVRWNVHNLFISVLNVETIAIIAERHVQMQGQKRKNKSTTNKSSRQV